MNDLAPYREKLYYLRGQNVMLDKDLAEFYGVDLRVFNQARKRKSAEFKDSTFQLTKEEWNEVRSVQGLAPSSGGNYPWAYNEEASFLMSYALSSETSRKVALLIVKVFLAVRDGAFVPRNNKAIQLVGQIEKVEVDRSGVTNNFHAPVTIIHGGTNQINNIHNSEELINNILHIMAEKEVSHNDDLRNLLNKTIELINKKDKKGALETITKAADLGTKIQKLAPWFLAAAEIIRQVL